MARERRRKEKQLQCNVTVARVDLGAKGRRTWQVDTAMCLGESQKTPQRAVLWMATPLSPVTQ